MTDVLLDTHTWAWSTLRSSELSQQARAAIVEAERVLLSPISIYEVAQKVRLGKWPDMAPVMNRLWDFIDLQGTVIAPVTADISMAAGLADWDHRDPFDRLIAATARLLAVPVITADRALAAAPGLRTIW
jgi:PIN domain nuclease of toxin-antitoxin system